MMNEVIDLIAQAIKGTEFAGNTYIAGGYVRDLVMGNQKSDLDIAVSLPQGGIKLAEFLHEKTGASHPVIFQQFGTALVEILGHRIEFVMTRSESYKRGCRKPQTRPGTLHEDIIRRDFTINSLVMDIITKKIHDLTGRGMDDISQGIIRATSDPDFIFQDDPLRILRAVRFANRLQFTIEPFTADAMKKDAHELETISWERRRDELEKIMLSSTPGFGIKMLYEYGLMTWLIPELRHSLADIPLLVIDDLSADFGLRMAAMLQLLASFPDFSSKTSTIFNRLKIAHCIRDNALFLMTKFREYELNPQAFCQSISLHKLVYSRQQKIQGFLDYCTAWAKKPSQKMQLDQLSAAIETIKIKLADYQFPLDGYTIKLEFPLARGPEIGQLKEKGFCLWLQNPQMDSSQIIELLKNY